MKQQSERFEKNSDYGFVNNNSTTKFMKKLIAALALALVASAPLQAQAVSSYQGTVNLASPSMLTPVWTKLVVANNVVTAYCATSINAPTQWTQVGQPQAITFANNPLLVGIYVSSHNVAGLSSGTIDNLTITPDSTCRLADCDIGAPALMGSANLINGVWTIAGSGLDIWGTSDQFNFQPWLVWGDCTITCRVTSLSPNGDAWQKIGVMVRDSYNTGAAYAAVCATRVNGVTFQHRDASNANPDKTLVVAPSTGTTAGVTYGYDMNTPAAYVLR